MRYFSNEQGMSLVEVVIAILILVIAVVPMLDLFDLGTRNWKSAGDETLVVNLAQGKMEEILAQDYATLQSEGPTAYDGFIDYEYKVTLTDYDLSKSLKQVKVELYPKNKPQEVTEMSTLLTKR